MINFQFFKKISSLKLYAANNLVSKYTKQKQKQTRQKYKQK